MNQFSIDREFTWRGEIVRASVLPETRIGAAFGRLPEPEEPHWTLIRSGGDRYVGPVYLPGEQNPPGWSGAVARFVEVLDGEVESD
jgi:hypothetical protein